MFAGIVVAEVERLHVRRDQLFLAFELRGDGGFHHVGLDAEKRRQRADIDDVLEQLALARIAVGAIADLRQRHRQWHSRPRGISTAASGLVES